VCKHHTLECYRTEMAFFDKCGDSQKPHCQRRLLTYRTMCDEYNIEYTTLKC